MSKPKITQQMRYRESLIKYANKYGVSKAGQSTKRESKYPLNAYFVFLGITKISHSVKSIISFYT